MLASSRSEILPKCLKDCSHRYLACRSSGIYDHNIFSAYVWGFHGAAEQTMQQRVKTVKFKLNLMRPPPAVDKEEVRLEEEAAGDVRRGGGAGHGRPDEGVVPAAGPTDLPHRLRWATPDLIWTVNDVQSCKSWDLWAGGWEQQMTQNPVWCKVNGKWSHALLKASGKKIRFLLDENGK